MDPNRRRLSSDIIFDSKQAITEVNVFENLLDTLLLQIFEYLNPRDLRRASSVCKRWHKIAKDSAFWKRVDTGSMNFNHNNIMKFLTRLPPYITKLRISLSDAPDKGMGIFLLSMIIQQLCPNLEELYIERCVLSTLNNGMGPVYKEFSRYVKTQIRKSLDSTVFCNKSLIMFIPQNLRVLSFRYLTAQSMPILFRLASVICLPKLEVLDLSTVFFEAKSRTPHIFDSCPHLRELYLTGSYVASGIHPFLPYFHNLKLLNLAMSCFKAEDIIKLHGFCECLEELYLCEMGFCDHILSFVDQDTFPKLRIICLCGSKVTMQSISRLFRLCRTLERFHANAVSNSKYGYYTFGGRDYKFHETCECFKVHLCNYKYHI